MRKNGVLLLAAVLLVTVIVIAEMDRRAPSDFQPPTSASSPEDPGSQAIPQTAPEQVPEAAPETGPGQPEPPQPRGPLFERYVVEASPVPAPTAEEIDGERRNRAGSTARFLVEGSRAGESEAYRAELRALPLGRTWDWCRDQIQALGFSFRDATWSARERPRFCVVKNRLEFRLEIALDSRGRVTRIDVGPNL